MKISIIGTGYVGLVTGVCLAYKGHEVICVDKKTEIVETINSTISPIFEKGLSEMLKLVVSEKKLRASSDSTYAINNSDITIIAVGTPFNKGEIDLSYIKECAREIGEALAQKDTYHVVCVKSTVVPGTTDTFIKEKIEEASNKKIGDFGLVMNPEFLREGCAVDDFMMPDRIVIGTLDDASFKVMASVYKDYFDAPIIKTNIRTAEMIKYTSNAFFANLISFSNEISNICESIGGIDALDVFNGLKLDKRIALKRYKKDVYPGLIQYLKPGCGFGGSCFPKDVKALLTHSKKNSYQPDILEAILKVNELQPAKMVKKLEDSLGNLNKKKIAVLGIAFKPETDDIRESPAISIIKLLLGKGAIVVAVDPEALSNTAKEIDDKNLILAENYTDALKDAEGALLVTSWEEYKNIKACEFKSLMNIPLVVDGRRVYDKSKMYNANIKYTGIGI
jgi:UDPglucose 6-dehydrogenase/GDP-mannose 6-dehydrogenase